MRSHFKNNFTSFVIYGTFPIDSSLYFCNFKHFCHLDLPLKIERYRPFMLKIVIFDESEFYITMNLFTHTVAHDRLIYLGPRKLSNICKKLCLRVL